ncbi:MAG: hypothetical protein ABIP69_00465 [Ferruginibacter sp.]
MSNSNTIHEFIKQFNLLKPDGIVGFAAKVVFTHNEIVKTRYTEVQILLGQNLNTIYLINPDLPFEDFPDTFMDKASTFIFDASDHLKIVSKQESDFFVEIYPVIVE